MAISFYDFKFNYIHTEPKFISSSWRINFNDTGSFEAHFPVGSEVADLIVKNKYLVAVQGELAAIVTGYDMNNELIIFGRSCNWILKKRVVLPFAEREDYSGNIARYIASQAFLDTADVKTEGDSPGSMVTFGREHMSLVFDVVRDCLSMTKSGHVVRFDIAKRKWIFKVLERTESSLVISEALKNAYDTAITGDILDMADCGYYERKTSDSDGNSITEPVFLNNGDKKGIYRWEALLDGCSEAEAGVSLNAKKENSTVTACTRQLLYNKDYQLGDIVRVQVNKGVLKKTEKMCICGVEVYYRNGARYEKPVLEEV